MGGFGTVEPYFADLGTGAFLGDVPGEFVGRPASSPPRLAAGVW